MNLTCFSTLEGLSFWRGENKKCTQMNIKCNGKWFLVLRANNSSGKLAMCWPLLDVLLVCCWSLVPKSCPIPSAPWTVAPRAPLAMALPRQEYWSGWPFPSPGDLPDPHLLHRHSDSLPLSQKGVPVPNLLSVKFSKPTWWSRSCYYPCVVNKEGGVESIYIYIYTHTHIYKLHS